MRPTGKRIAFFSRRGGNTGTYVMNADGSGVRRVRAARPTTSRPPGRPDGRKLAFLRFPQGEGPHPGDIAVVNVDGSGEHRVTRLSGAAPDPVWSPDGRTIAYRGQLRDLPDQRRRNRPAEVDAASPYGPGWDSEPAWSPDGKRIAYTSAGSNTPPAIYVMKVDGTARRRRTFGRTGDGSPAWSPDGRKILFTCEANRISDICVVGADGKGRLRLPEDEAENRNPAWQPLTG